MPYRPLDTSDTSATVNPAGLTFMCILMASAVAWLVGQLIVKILGGLWRLVWGSDLITHRFMFSSSEPITSVVLANVSDECRELDRVTSVTHVHDHGISTFLVPLTPVEMEHFTVRSVEGSHNNVIGLDIVFSESDRTATYTWLERVLDSVPGLTHPFHPDN